MPAPILVPIEGRAAPDQRHLAEAIRIHRREGAEVILLSVQPMVSGHVAAFFDPAQLHALQHETGLQELAPARDLLDAAGIPHRAVVRVGRRAPTIAGTARELGCDRIVLGEAAQEDRPVFGSIPAQVRELLAREASGPAVV